ncbi:MAG: hypothetical protein AAGC57_13170 [Pseudomonadota bacterium]
MAALDPAHRIATKDRFRAMAGEGRSVIVALHDLALAARWCTRLVMLSGGQVVADGPPEAVLTRERLITIDGVEALVERRKGALLVLPLIRAPGA